MWPSHTLGSHLGQSNSKLSTSLTDVVTLSPSKSIVGVTTLLSLVDNMEAHGGEITSPSSPGSSSCFHMVITLSLSDLLRPERRHIHK